MKFQTTLKQTTDGECYLEIPPDLGWQQGDEVEITVMTDLDTDLPCLWLTNHDHRSRIISRRIDEVNNLV